MEYLFITKKPNSHVVVHGDCKGVVFPGAITAEVLKLPRNYALAVPQTRNPDHYYTIDGHYTYQSGPVPNHEMWTDKTLNILKRCVPGPWYRDSQCSEGYTFSIARYDIPNKSQADGVIFTDGAVWCFIPENGEPTLGTINDWAPLAFEKLAGQLPDAVKDAAAFGRVVVGFRANSYQPQLRTLEVKDANSVVILPRISTESLPVYRILAALYRLDVAQYSVSGANKYSTDLWVDCSATAWLRDKRIWVRRVAAYLNWQDAHLQDTEQKPSKNYLYRAETKGLYIFGFSCATAPNQNRSEEVKYTVYVDGNTPNEGDAILQEMHPDFVEMLFRYVDTQDKTVSGSPYTQLFSYGGVVFRCILWVHKGAFQPRDTTLVADVKRLGDEYGYGRLMQLAQEHWRTKLIEKGMEGGEFAYGPCVSQVVPCPHPVKDKNDNCPVCAGSGHITKWVHDHLVAIGVIPPAVEEHAAPMEESDIPGETSPLVEAGIALSDIREWIETGGTIKGVHMDDLSVIKHITLTLNRIGEAP